MDVLYDRLVEIQSATGGKKDEPAGGEKKDPSKMTEQELFIEETRQIKDRLAKVREDIKTRDGLPAGTEQISLSQKIRKTIKGVEQHVEEMDAELKKKEEKLEEKEKNPKNASNQKFQEAKGLLQLRREQMDVIFQHIDECYGLEKKRSGGTYISKRKGGAKDPTVTSLPDIDDPRFLQLKQNDEIIDGLLDVIGSQASELKDIALTMSDEVDVQSKKLDKLSEHVDKTNETLLHTNEQLKETIEKVRAGDKICLDIILIIIIIGMIGLIIKIAKGM